MKVNIGSIVYYLVSNGYSPTHSASKRKLLFAESNWEKLSEAGLKVIQELLDPNSRKSISDLISMIKEVEGKSESLDIAQL